MEDYPYPYPWKELSGTPEEMAFLDRRFVEMSVREGYLLEGAARLQSIDNAADLINLTEQLDNFEFFYSAMEDRTLGHYYAKYREAASADQMPYLDLKRWGVDLRERHGGVFVSGGYVEQTSPCRQIYNGENLSQMTGGWSVKLKLASEHCPEGVWVKLPDHEIHTGEPDELAVALGELVTLEFNKLGNVDLLEAKCCLDNITDLAEQYDSLEQLIEDGNNLGYVLEECGQGMICFEERFRAAMELEGCTRLDEALDITQNLRCYDFIPTEQHWEKFGKDLARKRKIVDPDTAIGMYFDYAAYCKTEINRLRLKPCAHGYIARNSQEFICEFSRRNDLAPKNPSMGM
ncbi:MULTISPECIES: hypothetical protein [unclassified Dehalobacter]|uniref:hypothetical protein n=1 Tax=unclassified Dehalobacter TaxID=2635733 RepID=UPI000E6B6A19|nr:MULTISPECIES: hypothetical protein [unclassified Dehalobacter]RJE46597.1 hypothetical protein A7K50_12590 [Dehalobacter sp. MCB1]TCX47365.1 hypothetical protein C1I36_13750 [Dehalobacter sp. 14DCB1]TCX55578.1 hypothetical protein C1I38_02715 [Dehalobacter sp. 12DCB1]